MWCKARDEPCVLVEKRARLKGRRLTLGKIDRSHLGRLDGDGDVHDHLVADASLIDSNVGRCALYGTVTTISSA